MLPKRRAESALHLSESSVERALKQQTSVIHQGICPLSITLDRFDLQHNLSISFR